MGKLIDKDALVAEIERRIKVLQKHPYESHKTIYHLESLKQSLDTLEVKEVDLEKDMQDALHMEYEKGRADVIADTLSWLANVWPQYCSNPNIIDAYKEGVVKE